MEDVEIKVTFKGKKAKMVLKEEDDGINGYVAKTKVLTLAVDDSEDEATTSETFHHEDLDVDEDEVSEAVLEALDDADDEDEDEDEDEEDDEDDEDDEDEDEDDEDEDDEDEDDDKVEEDADADYGDPIKNAERKGVPTLHAVMVVYGEGIDVDSDVRVMRKLLGALQDQKIVNVAEQLFHGAEATGQGALDAVGALEPAADDVVWFCYSGHGCMEEGDRLFNTCGPMLRRQAIVDAVTATSARLKMITSDCCAVEIGRVAPEEKVGAGHGTAPPSEKLRKLFRDYSGVFDVSSSDSFQYSFGGVFTPTLVDKVLLGNTPDTWQQVFDKTQKMTMASAEGALPEDAKKKLKKEGKKAEDHQKPIAFTLPTLG